ncbi:Dihydroorotate dehydrogenase-domain-containing protein [Hyaloraphidium curvatum]|nr:Dihydroorotate dehydrogenase-domain-containing protein [Hyaloraphidium curvatum]
MLGSAPRTVWRLGPALPAGELVAALRARAAAGAVPGLRGATRHASSRAPGTRISDDFDGRIVFLVKLAVFGGAAAVVAAYLTDSRAAVHKYFTMPVVHRLVDPEDAHRWSIEAAKIGLAPRERSAVDSPELVVELWGKTFANPLGLAAGYDKNAEAVDALLDMGFGFVEVGSVTPRPQPGNPRPRLFRLHADYAAINRYGLNSQGADEVAQRLVKRAARWAEGARRRLGYEGVRTPAEAGLPMSLRDGKLLGVNLSKNKGSPEESNADYVVGVEKLGPLADYLVVNVSCPNQTGITSLQRKGVLEGVMRDVCEARDRLPNRPPILVKIGPDNSDEELADIAAAVLTSGVDGAIISNTTNQRPDTLKSDARRTFETGGLSGPPLKPLALRTLRNFYRLTRGAVPIIGCGGISTAGDALEYARSGASLVQLYTGMSYGGPGVVYDIKTGVKEELARLGQKWTDIVGEDVRFD